MKNIAFADANPNQAKIKDCLNKVNLTNWVESLPNGIHTSIGELGSQISGGQRQRIAIARALYKDSEIYKILGIHAIYPTQHTLEKKYVKPYNFLQTHFKLKFLNYNSLFITRDPIERFLSGFNDRVLFQNKLKITK